MSHPHLLFPFKSTHHFYPFSLSVSLITLQLFPFFFPCSIHPNSDGFLLHLSLENHGSILSSHLPSSPIPLNCCNLIRANSLLSDPILDYSTSLFWLISMGASFSAACSQPPSTGLDDLPENCVAEVLMRLDPPQICNLARLSRTFHMASSADFVWESKLPSNYRFLVKKVLGEDPTKLSKKEIYARLCRANSFDGGHKAVWLEKRCGGICFAVSWRALRITGIDDRRYWKHLPAEESRFKTMAYLQQIWWFEVEGEVEFEFPAGRYSIYFRIQLGKPWRRLGRKVCNMEQVHGWEIKPVQFQLSTSDGQHALSQCYLYEHPAGSWVHYHAGDFMVEEKKPANGSMKVKFSMTQIDCTHTKGGLCLDSVFICPSPIPPL